MNVLWKLLVLIVLLNAAAVSDSKKLCGKKFNFCKNSVCNCPEGLKPNKNRTCCVPNCENKCIGGKCVDVNKCRCLPGHSATNIPYVCEPFCSNCTNGYCYDYEKCAKRRFNDGKSESQCGSSVALTTSVLGDQTESSTISEDLIEDTRTTYKLNDLSTDSRSPKPSSTEAPLISSNQGIAETNLPENTVEVSNTPVPTSQTITESRTLQPILTLKSTLSPLLIETADAKKIPFLSTTTNTLAELSSSEEDKLAAAIISGNGDAISTLMVEKIANSPAGIVKVFDKVLAVEEEIFHDQHSLEEIEEIKLLPSVASDDPSGMTAEVIEKLDSQEELIPDAKSSALSVEEIKLLPTISSEVPSEMTAEYMVFHGKSTPESAESIEDLGVLASRSEADNHAYFSHEMQMAAIPLGVGILIGIVIVALVVSRLSRNQQSYTILHN